MQKLDEVEERVVEIEGLKGRVSCKGLYLCALLCRGAGVCRDLCQLWIAGGRCFEASWHGLRGMGN